MCARVLCILNEESTILASEHLLSVCLSVYLVGVCISPKPNAFFFFLSHCEKKKVNKKIYIQKTQRNETETEDADERNSTSHKEEETHREERDEQKKRIVCLN